MFQIKIDDNSNLILIWPHHHFQQNMKELFCQKYITSVLSQKWPALAAKSHTRQKKDFFFYLGFLSRSFTIHRTVGEGGGYLFNSSLPLPPASQTLRH